MIDLNIKPKILELLGENTGEKTLNLIPKAEFIKEIMY